MKIFLIGWFILGILGIIRDAVRQREHEALFKEKQGVPDPLPNESECVIVAERIVNDPKLAETTLFNCAKQFLGELEKPAKEKYAPRNRRLRIALVTAIANYRQLQMPLE